MDGKTPYEILYGQAPSYKHIRTFGCLCYAHDQNRDKDKFASRSLKCIFVGYPFGKKGWRLYDLESGEYFVSRDVIFVEVEFPCFNNVVNSSLTENRVVDFSTDDEDPYMKNDMEEQQAFVSDVEHEIDVEMGHNMEMATDGNTEVGDRGGIDVSRPMVSEEQFGKRKRVKQPSVRLKDYVTHTIRVSPSTSSSFQSKSSGTPYPLVHYVNCDKFLAQHRFFLAVVAIGCEPSTYAEAIKDECWREAMRKEIQTLEDNET